MTDMGKKYVDKPIGFQVLVEQELLPMTIGESDISIYSNEDEWIRDQASHTICIIVAVGDTAFHHDRYGYDGSGVWVAPVKVGDKVRVRGYAGHQFREGRDPLNRREGKFMVLIQDLDIFSIVAEEEHVWPKEEKEKSVIAVPESKIIVGV